jgi:hypothetical protein
LFVCGEFFTYDLPSEKAYLYRYFTSDVQRQFVRYYLLFGEFDHFVDHTGHYCSRRWLERLCVRLKKLEEAKQAAKKAFDLSLLAQIEAGEYNA